MVHDVAVDARRARIGTLLVICATVCWASSGILAREVVGRFGVSPVPVAFWRDFMAFVVLLAFAVLFRRDLLRVPRAAWWPLLGAGIVGIGLFHVLWVHSVLLLDIALAHVLNYTAPVFVVLASWALLGEAITARKLLAVAMTLVGGAMVAQVYDLGQVRVNAVGVLVGLGTGVAGAVYTLLSKVALQRRVGSWTVLLVCFGFASPTIFAFRPVECGALVTQEPAGVWPWLLALALIPNIAAFGLFTLGLRYLTASAAAISAAVETLMAALAAFFVYGEVPAPLQMIGGALILLAVILLGSRRKKPSPQLTPVREPVSSLDRSLD